ncbi:FSH1-domain-containing protein [Leucogyrophana mollusca]|uniref:FSH1-domain-containing protein n=1 Tax=Leucogyrophana mollusca TaxID=85980 RepID=A0ACB8BHG0_9AGAM|nr:FSH1-domain-containing protein [Leucogyrophana mollusca]
MAATRKVLMLHGYGQNANIFSRRLGALRKSMPKDIELVFIDAPLILHPVDLVGSSAITALGALGVPEAASDPNMTPRAWWKSNADRTVTHGMEESLLLLKDTLSRNRYDGVFGFSQGAAMAALLAALLEKPHLYPPFLINEQPPHPPFQFCVAVSGFKPSWSVSAEIFGASYSTPTLHVLGRTDVIVVPERSQVLVDLSSNKRVEEHDGGHFVPSKANWRTFMREYLRDPLGNVPSPGTRSQTDSGSVTPDVSNFRPGANL